SIQHAVEEAEHMAGVEITQVYAGIAGAHIKSLNSQGVWAVKDREVKESDIAAVLEQAKAINIPQDREIIHVLPQEYTIDHQDGIKEPLGMSGVRLEARVHLVTASVTSAQNIIKCCHRCGLQVADVVLEPRGEEIFMLVRREIEKTAYEDKLASGAVITGGSTILEGMPELAEEVLGMPVRRGSPMGVGGLIDVVRTPQYATAVGLVQYG